MNNSDSQQIQTPNPNFNEPSDIYTRGFTTVAPTSTIGEWVDAFNNNALASTDHTWYLG